VLAVRNGVRRSSSPNIHRTSVSVRRTINEVRALYFSNFDGGFKLWDKKWRGTGQPSRGGRNFLKREAARLIVYSPAFTLILIMLSGYMTGPGVCKHKAQNPKKNQGHCWKHMMLTPSCYYRMARFGWRDLKYRNRGQNRIFKNLITNLDTNVVSMIK